MFKRHAADQRIIPSEPGAPYDGTGSGSNDDFGFNRRTLIISIM